MTRSELMLLGTFFKSELNKEERNKTVFIVDVPELSLTYLKSRRQDNIYKYLKSREGFEHLNDLRDRFKNIINKDKSIKKSKLVTVGVSSFIDHLLVNYVDDHQTLISMVGADKCGVVVMKTHIVFFYTE